MRNFAGLLFLSLFMTTTAVADTDYSALSDGQLNQHLARAEAGLANCRERIAESEVIIKRAESGLRMMTVPEYLDCKDDLEKRKRCFPGLQKKVDLIKAEIAKRANGAIEEPGRHRGLAKAREKADEITIDIGQFHDWVAGLERRLTALEPREGR